MAGCVAVVGQALFGGFERERQHSPDRGTKASRRLSEILSWRRSTGRVDSLSGTTLASRSRGRTSPFLRPWSFSPHPTDEPSLSFGRTLGPADFEPRRMLGSGASGSVYLVADRLTGQEFALKTIRKADLTGRSHYFDVFEELRILKCLGVSQWALSLEAAFHDEDYFYLLTKYYVGGSLRQTLKYRSFSPELVEWVMAELVLAVEDIHRQGIVHGDLKPDNILTDEHGHIVLADFGRSLDKVLPVAYSEGSWDPQDPWKTQENVHDSAPDVQRGPDVTHSMRGTAGYMAPEAWAGDTSYPADVWSLGAVLYVLCYGKLPFDMDPWQHSVENLRVRTVYDRVAFPSAGYCPVAADLMQKMLDKNPLTRISLAEMKNHPYFCSIDWRIVAERLPLPKSVTSRVVDYGYSVDSGVLPCGGGYRPGCDPFPWFRYASPKMQVPCYLPPKARGKRSLSEDAPRKPDAKYDQYRQAAREKVDRWVQFITVPAARVLPPGNRRLELD